MDFYINLEITSEGFKAILYNFPVETLGGLDREVINENILGVKWYMYGAFDLVNILGMNWIISNKTKTKIELIKSNPQKD